MRLIIALLVACTGSEYQVRTSFVAYDLGAVTCDYRQTSWASDDGRWDKPTGGAPGEVYMEKNPVLGAAPSTLKLRTYSALGALSVVAFGYAPKLPPWVRWTGLVTIAIAENFVITDTMQHGVPFCGGVP